MTTRLKPGKARAVLALLGAAMCTLAQADGQIYKCTDASGRVEYTDINRGAYCKSMDLPGTIAAPPARHQTAPHNIAPAEAPHIDSAEQRERDADRRGILTDELRNEQQKLAALRQEYNNGEPERRGDERNYAKYLERVAQLKDDISRSEKNIDALNREIANLK